MRGARLSRCARARTGSDRAGVASFRVASMVRAGHDGAGMAEMRCQQARNAFFPRPVAADFQGAAAGVADEPGRDVPQSVTERIWFCV